jgi:ubiquitin carboxyl-terminal hydrolase L3
MHCRTGERGRSSVRSSGLAVVIWMGKLRQNSSSFYQPDSDSPLGRLLHECVPLPPERRALALEESLELKEAHTSAAVRGDTRPPDNADVEVDFHYACLVDSAHDRGRLLWMDGDRKGPIDLGITLAEEEDLLSDQALDVVRSFIAKYGDGSVNYNLMALVAPKEDSAQSV